MDNKDNNHNQTGRRLFALAGFGTVRDGTSANPAYALSRDGDTPLCPTFEEAIIRCEAREVVEISPEQLREDAELIAVYILVHPPTDLTQSAQKDVEKLLNISRLSDEDLAEQNLDRESVTIALEQANQSFLRTQRLEVRIPLIGLSDFAHK